MRADGGDELLLLGGPRHEWAGRWSPDGRSLTLWSDRDSPISVPNVYVVRADGSGLRQLTRDGGGGVSWSRDGRWIAYGDATGGISIVSPNGGAPRSIAGGNVGGTRSIGAGDVAGWSSDSRTVYYRPVLQDGSLPIAAAYLDGRPPQIVVRFDQPDRTAYRPEVAIGAGAFFFTIGRHEADIWVMRLNRD